MSEKNFQHFSDDQLLLRLYGASEENSAHLESCGACRERWFALMERREELLAQAESAAAKSDLLCQRRRILSRIEHPAPVHAKLRSVWVPATVAALTVAGIIANAPESKKGASLPTISQADEASEIEARWFEDVYSISQSMEPRAASPIRGLFKGGSVLE